MIGVRTSPLVVLRGITRAFPGPPERQAIAGVNLTVEEGEFLSVIGPSGSGKSTLLNVLGLLDRPSVGEYQLDGVLTSTLDDRERAAVRAHRIGFVFQAFHLLERHTVLANVVLAMRYAAVPRTEREERAVEALDRVGLVDRAGSLPSVLSGGERQRVAVARAMVTRPDLLLADEPTGNLDRSSADEVMELFRGLHREGKTVVAITHDAEVARSATRTIRLLGGRLVSGGAK